MNYEGAHTFRPTQEGYDTNPAVAIVKKIKDAAMGDDADFNVTANYMDIVAKLSDTLKKEYNEVELVQVSAFHALTGSGEVESMQFKEPISAERKKEIEDKILASFSEESESFIPKLDS